MKHGIHHGISDTDYFAVDAASNSTIGRMQKSAAHCKHYIDNGMSQTPAMALGSLVHCLVLEPDEFVGRYCIKPDDIDRRTKAGKEAYAEFLHDSVGKEIITSDQLHEATNIASSVLTHTEAAEYMKAPGKSEASAFWYDNEIGIECKCRFDRLLDNGIAVDLKTTADASAEGFAKSIVNFGYHRQQAMYTDGHKSTAGREPERFVFVAVETKPPYAVAVYELDPASVDIGRHEYRELLAAYAQCQSTGNWPGYPDEVQPLSLPGWKMAQFENQIVEDII